MSRQLTIRNVPEQVAKRLSRISKEKGKSINATVLQILEQAVGEQGRRHRLERYATWTDQDLEEFDSALATQRVIDEEIWR